MGSRYEAVPIGEFGRLVEAILPAFVRVEKVPEIAWVPSISTFRRFLRMLDRDRHERTTRGADGQAYGVIRKRRRLVLLSA